MECDEPRLILEGNGRRVVIGAEFWNDVVDWAAAQGWIADSAEHSDSRSDCEFTSAEAAKLAEALDVIGGNLVLHSQTDVPETFLVELAAALQTLQTFAATGGFRVRELSPQDDEY